MQVDRVAGREAWRHRPWCAAECPAPAGSAEGTHLGQAWALAPAGEDGTRVEVRLCEPVGTGFHSEVGVLVSVTERRLHGDRDPLAELHGDPALAPSGALADFSASAGLSAREAGRLCEQLVAVTAMCTPPRTAPWGGGRRVTGIERDLIGAELKERYEAGASIRDLTTLTGRSYGFVHTILTEYQTVLRGQERQP